MVDLSNVIMMEEALTAKKRNSLDNSKFALVYKDDKGKTIRKYPVHDKAHVQAASKMFPRGVPEKYQGKVARRILAEAREYKLDTSGWDNVNKAADKKVVQEFEDPIKSLQEATSGSYNFMNHLMTINLLNSGNVQESLKQLNRNGLKPVMFMGFMDPDNVNRCEYKDLEKHVIYAAGNGTLYASFFNSFSRTKEISEIALSLDALIDDLPNKKVSQEHIPSHMNDCMITLSDDNRVIHSKGNVPMKMIYEEAFYMNTYYSYFATYEAFEFKRNSLYKDISKVILEQFSGDESQFDFESVDVVQETHGSAKIHIRFRYDNEPFVVVIQTESMKTLPAKLYRESARNEEGSGEMESNINKEETPIQEQEVDENGLIKVNNIPSDIMYFGSYKDFGNNMLKLSKPRLFVTPYMGIASIFTVDRSRYNIPPGQSVNLAYDEWNIDDNTEPFDEIHTIVEGIPDFPERSFENTGWIYGIDVSKFKDKIYQEKWMNPEKEFLIIDVPEIPIAKKIRHEMVVNVRGGDFRTKPFEKEVVQESISSALPGHKLDAAIDYHIKRVVNLRNHFMIFEHQHGLSKGALKRTKLQLEDISDGREPYMLIGYCNPGNVRHSRIKDLDRHAAYKASDGIYSKLFNDKGELEKVAETGSELIDSFDTLRVPVSNIPEHMRSCDVYMYRDDVIRAALYGATLIPYMAFLNTYLFQKNVPIEFIHKSDTVSVHTYYAYFATYETLAYCLAGLGRKIWLLVARVWAELSQPNFRKITIKEESDTKTSVVVSIISRDRGFDLKFSFENFESKNCVILNEDGSKVRWFHKYTKPITVRESEGMDPEDYEDLHDHINDEDDIYNESWNDFKRGINSHSKKLMFHISDDPDLDKITMEPRVPSYIVEKSNNNIDPNYPEDASIPRICVSPSIEGCIIATFSHTDVKYRLNDLLYVYTPMKPFDAYEHKTNKELVKEKLVFDANITGEAWILEPCKMRLFGIIRIKKVPNMINKETVNKGIRVSSGSFDWEWVLAPKAAAGWFYPDEEPEEEEEPIQESDAGTTKGYRYTDGRDGTGIYEALKAEMYQKNGLTPAPWREFLDSDAGKWLPKPPKYNDSNESWFTEEGNEKFKELTLPIVKEYIKNVKMETKDIPNAKIVYSDEYQFVVDNSITVQEAFFGIGFGNLRKTIADRLGKYCTVTNVQNPTGKEEKFVVKLNEDPEDFVNVVSTGTGVKAYGYKHGERFSIFNNAALSAAAQKLIDAICDEFNIKLSVQESFSMFLDDEESEFIQESQELINRNLSILGYDPKTQTIDSHIKDAKTGENFRIKLIVNDNDPYFKTHNTPASAHYGNEYLANDNKDCDKFLANSFIRAKSRLLSMRNNASVAILNHEMGHIIDKIHQYFPERFTPEDNDKLNKLRRTTAEVFENTEKDSLNKHDRKIQEPFADAFGATYTSPHSMRKALKTAKGSSNKEYAELKQLRREYEKLRTKFPLDEQQRIESEIKELTDQYYPLLDKRDKLENDDWEETGKYDKEIAELNTQIKPLSDKLKALRSNLQKFDSARIKEAEIADNRNNHHSQAKADNRNGMTKKIIAKMNENPLPAQSPETTAPVNAENTNVQESFSMFLNDEVYPNNTNIQEAFMPSGKVAFLCKRWSTENKAQFDTLDVFWDIINEYMKSKNIPTSEVCGYGTNWTGYGTDFVYGVFFKNQKTIPNDLLAAVREKISDIEVRDLNIPAAFDGSKTCKSSKMEETYDEIWDKGFLAYELEEYPNDDTIKISYKYRVLYANNEEWNKRWQEYKTNKQPMPIQESFIPLKREHKEIDHVKNCISYAMGVDDSINELKSQGFGIFPDGEDYKVRFNADKSEIWESYINEHLKDTYWNEYINLNTMDIVFMIKENDTIQRIENHNMEENDSLLETCNRLCEGNFKTIKDLIYSNDFYKEAIENNPFKLKFNNPNIHMRPATEDDIENMYQWEMESIDKSLIDNEKVQSLIRQDCHDSLKDTLMIMDGDNTIGMFTACMIDDGEWRYIGEIYIIPEYRGQGIGSTILRNEMANYDKIRLQVAMDNEGAFKLYTSLGFKIAKEDDTNKMYIMEYVKPENIQEAVTIDGYRLIELAYMDKFPNMSPEQEAVLKDYSNARDQLVAAASYYKREKNARKKALKRIQLQHNTSDSDYFRNQCNQKMAVIRQEIEILDREYAEAYQRNVATMNQLADEFDKLEAQKQKNGGSTPQPSNSGYPDSIVIPLPRMQKPSELLGKFLHAQEDTEL